MHILWVFAGNTTVMLKISRWQDSQLCRYCTVTTMSTGMPIKTANFPNCSIIWHAHMYVSYVLSLWGPVCILHLNREDIFQNMMASSHYFQGLFEGWELVLGLQFRFRHVVVIVKVKDGSVKLKYKHVWMTECIPLVYSQAAWERSILNTHTGTHTDAHTIASHRENISMRWYPAV